MILLLIASWAEVSAESDHHENYWSDDGNATLLHGFTTFGRGFAISYDSPILWIDPPLNVGKSWSTMVQALSDLRGEVPSGGPFTLTMSVVDAAVPAGSPRFTERIS